MVLQFQNARNIECYQGFMDVYGVCPGCGVKVKFVHFFDSNDIIYTSENNYQIITGQRMCPDEKCATHIFFEYWIAPGGTITSIKILPLNFQLANLSLDKLPIEVLECFKEATICYANNCFSATAILIRKILETICSINNVNGKNLHEKLELLKNKVTLSNALYEAMFELKYLGNDAAHIKSKHFEKIDQKEAELGLTILIEILRALYEHEDLLNSFKALKINTN